MIIQIALGVVLGWALIQLVVVLYHVLPALYRYLRA